MNHQPTIVLDLDGTLCNDLHRNEMARAKLWDEYHAAAVQDVPHKDVMAFCQMYHASPVDICLLAVTGRPEKWRNQTIDWLRRHRVFPDALLMRPDHDYQRAGDTKVALLEKHFGSKEAVLANVLFCLEDTDAVVEVLRNYGLNVWHVRSNG